MSLSPKRRKSLDTMTTTRLQIAIGWSQHRDLCDIPFSFGWSTILNFKGPKWTKVCRDVCTTALSTDIACFMGVTYAPIDDVKKRAARNLLLQDIDAVQRRIDHPRRPIWKYIIGLLVAGALGQLQARMNRIDEVLSSFVTTISWNPTILVNTTTSATTMATKSPGTIPRSVVLPWAAWTILTIFIVRSEFRQWVTRTISSSLKTLQHAAMLGNPVPPSELGKIERRWLWSFLLWKTEH
ncbi:hypothetical protein BGX38DRAFT_696481 [Terfezia claveryi]|nr:hypothetical protein BGX38DRAFT_696481 [Terfezia claveryi]